MWRAEALRYSRESHPWLRKRSPACARFIAAAANTSIWAHAMEHHALLVDALRLFCFKRRARRRLLNAQADEAASPTMIDSAPYAWGSLRSVPDVFLKKGAPLDTFFRPLRKPRLASLSRGRHTRYTIVFAPPDICRLVLAPRSDIGRRFVLVGPWTPAPSFGSLANFGALPRGYDHGCRVEPSEEGASACMLKAHFVEHCPNATLEHVREFLDDSRLIAWYVHHDAILFRDPTTGAFASHPKLVSLPLGAQIKLDEAWADIAVSRLEQRMARPQLIIVKDNGMGMRKIVTRQLTHRFGVLANESGRSRANEFEYMRTLMSSKTISAPYAAPSP